MSTYLRSPYVFVPALALTALCSLGVGCGDDEGDGGTSSNPTTGNPTTTGTGGMGAGGMATGGTMTTTTSTGGGGMGTGGGPNPACEMLPAAPLEAVEVLDVFNGSEDIAVDWQGRIVGKDGQNVIAADLTGQTTTIATGVGMAYGLRYMANGNLVVAYPGQNKLVTVTPAGVVSDYVDVTAPNGVYPDSQGNVWVTEFTGNGTVTRVNADQTMDVIVDNVVAANGVVFDETRQVVFFTNYQTGDILRSDLSGNVTDVANINGSPDGLALDECGNIYVVDQGGSDLYRIRLDAAGDALGEPELLVSTPANIANAHFGRAAGGTDPTTLYLGGNPGVIYAVQVGVAGAIVPPPAP